MNHNHEPFRQISPLFLSQVQSGQVELENSEPSSAVQGSAPLLLLGLLALGLFLLQILNELRTVKQKVVSRRSLDVPCYRCLFFSNNVHLKCAVRPMDVLTKSASHCPDYSSLADAAPMHKD